MGWEEAALSYILPPGFRRAHREDGRKGRPEWFLFLGSGLHLFSIREGFRISFLQAERLEQLFVPKVPPDCQVEHHIGKDNSVLQEGKDGIHFSLTIHAVPKVDSQHREGDEVDEELLLPA